MIEMITELNLAKNLKDEGKLTEMEYSTVIERNEKIIEMIDKEPKTKNWLKRSKVGTAKPWYRDVDEIIL